jgi:hypothetical protein
LGLEDQLIEVGPEDASNRSDGEDAGVRDPAALDLPNCFDRYPCLVCDGLGAAVSCRTVATEQDPEVDASLPLGGGSSWLGDNINILV